jgi:hypothetical protein
MFDDLLRANPDFEMDDDGYLVPRGGLQTQDSRTQSFRAERLGVTKKVS